MPRKAGPKQLSIKSFFQVSGDGEGVLPCREQVAAVHPYMTHLQASVLGTKHKVYTVLQQHSSTSEEGSDGDSSSEAAGSDGAQENSSDEEREGNGKFGGDNLKIPLLEA